LHGIEAIVQWQEHMAPEGDNQRLLGLGQHGGPRFRRPGFQILDRRALAPLRHLLRVDAQFPAQLRERSLRMPSAVDLCQKPRLPENPSFATINHLSDNCSEGFVKIT
jgi:hypothetical protein